MGIRRHIDRARTETKGTWAVLRLIRKLARVVCYVHLQRTTLNSIRVDERVSPCNRVVELLFGLRMIIKWLGQLAPRT